MYTIPSIVLIGAALVLAWLLWNYSMEKYAVSRRHWLLSSRQIYRDPEQWLHERWIGSLSYEEDVYRVCKALSQRLRIDPTQLYESDRFDRELAISTAYYTAIDVDDQLNSFLHDDLPELTKLNSSPSSLGESLGAIVRQLQSF